MDDMTLERCRGDGGDGPSRPATTAAPGGVATLGDGYAVQQRANAVLERSARPTRRPQDRRHDRVHAPLHQRARAAGRRGLRQPGPRRRRHGAAGRICPAGHRDRDRRAARPRPAAATGTLHAATTSHWPSPPAWRRSSWSTTATTISPPSAARPRSPTTPSTPACVLGRPLLDWQGLDLAALTGRTWRDGALLAEGRSDALLGHPLDALAWLATKRSQPRAGAGRRHLRQPRHDHAGAVGRRRQATSGSRWSGWAR